MPEHRPTVEDVKDGLAKLIREVRNLQAEVKGLTEALKGFDSKHPKPAKWNLLPPSAGGTDWRSRYETDEPESQITAIRYEYMADADLEIPTRTLLVIARELDGALRDIRASRVDIKAIADDSDRREDFKEWQRSRQD